MSEIRDLRLNLGTATVIHGKPPLADVDFFGSDETGPILYRSDCEIGLAIPLVTRHSPSAVVQVTLTVIETLVLRS